MKFGIIGYGRMGKLYEEVLNEIGVKVEFICDLRKEIEDKKYFKNYKDAFDLSEVDGVIISTYGPSHHEIIKYAIKKNIKFLICEKPFTTSIKHADEIIYLLENSRTKLTVSYLRRFSKTYNNLIKKLYNEKIIGEVKTFIVTSGAGGISTLGTHYIDLSTYIISEKIKSVFAIPINKNHPNPRGKEFEDPGGYFVLNFENDKRAFFDMSDDLGLQPKIEIIGTYGRIEISEINKKIIGYCRKNEDKNKPMRFYGLENRVVLDEEFNFEPLNELIKKLIENILSNESIKITPDIAREKVEIYSGIRKSFDLHENILFPILGDYYEREFMVT